MTAVASPLTRLSFQLFFPNRATGKLQLEIRTVVYQGEISTPILAMGELLESPKHRSLSLTVPAGTRVNGLTGSRDRLLVADLSNEREDGFRGGASEEAFTVAAIVNTLLSSNFGLYNKVQLLIDGHKVDTLGRRGRHLTAATGQREAGRQMIRQVEGIGGDPANRLDSLVAARVSEGDKPRDAGPGQEVRPGGNRPGASSWHPGDCGNPPDSERHGLLRGRVLRR